ncbi:DUF1223 domain-containing protein [Bythopirellula polymerisocia]|uniref:DUF1223 domain-containing protein n=1 Tax=Bythopirellula polymerisocia TaxID=2528003 RepID=A0A5C6D2R5_9BACT|nr:DUF1223 domain-containing protein [Bythopirellula polymerisocia]TWU29947.1 hypothetical protein Pla144_07280 [Bythopirellula polymerisocia]
MRIPLFFALPALVFPLLLAALFASVSTSLAETAEQKITEETTGVAVVELFTSQGCSSCPPADQLLTALSSLNTEHQMPVYCLSFHVDYWNSLGWSDPYSSKQSSKRQHRYATVLETNRTYTPQMIVNGAEEFVGSNAERAKAALKSALSKQATATINLRTHSQSDEPQLTVEFAVTGDEEQEILNIALVQAAAQNEVPQGENSGKTLSHVNVVRGFQTLDLDTQQGKAFFALPVNTGSSEYLIIAYVQNRDTGQITGANSTAVDLQ